VFRLFGTISINKAAAIADLKAVEVAAQTSGSKITSAFASIGKIAEKALKLGAAVAVAGLSAAMYKGVKAAAAYETAMVELAKVTDPDTAKSVGAAIREMAKEMPLAHEALMGIAADAGRLGVEGVDNILNFTDTVAKIAVATDIMAEDAGTNFAKLLTLLGEDIDKVDELGSVINELSNNMATSSSEIVGSMLRSSAALKGLDFGTAEIAALNAAMNEVSVSARVAGTALRTIAENLKNPEKMEKLAEVLGITVEQFRALRQEDPMELFKQLAMAMAEGGEKAEALTGILGASASRLQSLATNWESVEEAVEMANEQYETATSLQKEYNIATDTFNSRLQVLRNNFHDVAIDVGNELIPTLDKFIVWMQSNTPEIKELFVGIAEGIANTLGWILEHKEGIGDALKVIGIGIAGLGLASMLANLNPIHLAITAITLAIAALLVYWDDIVGFFGDLWDSVNRAIGGSITRMAGTIGSWLDFGKDAGEQFVRGMQKSMTPEDLKEIADGLGDTYGSSFAFAAVKAADTGLAAGGLGGLPGLSGFAGPTAGGVDFTPTPRKADVIRPWREIWKGITDGTKDFWADLADAEKSLQQKIADITKEFWGDLLSITKGGLQDLFVSIGHGLMGQRGLEEAHAEKMKGIREETLTEIDEEMARRDLAVQELDDQLAERLISEEEYNEQRKTIMENYEDARLEALEAEKRMLEEEKNAYKEAKKSIWETLQDSVQDVLTALKETLLVKAAAALAEAIALAFVPGMQAVAAGHLAAAGAYGAGAIGLHITGFEKGALFDRPTVIPPSLVGEGGYKEAFLPLSPDVFGEIGQGIVNAMNVPSPVLAGAGIGGQTINIDNNIEIRFEEVNVRDDADITRIARETYDLWQSRMRGRGWDV